MNQDAGRGEWLYVKLRLEDGEELPFIVDSGCPVTVLAKSLEPKLGKRLGREWFTMADGVKLNTSVYASPKLYLGSTPLMTDGRIVTADIFKQLSAQGGCPVMGILGMNCLKHYCIQLDFAADKMRFLGAGLVGKVDWGKPYVLTDFNHGCFTIRENLAGAKGQASLIDTGCTDDGWLTPKLFRHWTNYAATPANGETRSPNGQLDGDTYPAIDLRGMGEFNVIGLQFLARHLVTLDFPHWTMYLKRTSDGPLPQPASDTAAHFLQTLKKEGRLPGWSKDEHGQVLEGFWGDVYPVSGTFDAQKNGDPSIYHYTIFRASKDSHWKLQKAWRTDRKGFTVEEYKLP